MTEDELRMKILRLLGDIAPEAEAADLQPDLPIRDQLDIDSMDFLNLVIALTQTLKVEIPEAAYPRLATLNGMVAYLSASAAEMGR